VSCRGLYVDFTGTEETVISGNKGRSRARTGRARPWSSGGLPLRGEGTLPPDVPIPFRFQIPLHGLPSYAGRHANVK